MNKAVTLAVALVLLCGMSWASSEQFVTKGQAQEHVRLALPDRGQAQPPPVQTQDDVLLFQDFNGSWSQGSPPAGWTIYYTTPADYNDWNRYYFWSPYNAWIYYWPDEYDDDSLVSPIINCGTYVNVKMQVWTYFSDYNGSSYTAQLIGSNDGGATWPYLIKDYTGNSLYGATEYFDLDWADTKSQVKLAWVFTGQHYNFNYWVIDDVQVEGDLQLADDMRVLSIVSPAAAEQFCVCETIFPVAEVQNMGTNPQTNVDVRCRFWDKGTSALAYEEVLTIASINSGETQTLTFPPFIQPGTEGVTYIDTVQTELVGDMVPANDKMARENLVSAYGGGEVNYYDDGSWYVALAMPTGGEFAWKFPTPGMGVKGCNIQAVWWGYGNSSATQHILVYNADGTGEAPGTIAYEGDYTISAGYYEQTNNYLTFPVTVQPTTPEYYISHLYLTNYGVGPCYDGSAPITSGNDWMRNPGGEFQLLSYVGYSDGSYDGMTHPFEATAIHDMSMLSIEAPPAEVDSNTTITPVVTVWNAGMKARGSVPVVFDFVDSTGAILFTTTTGSGPTAKGEEVTLTFPDSYLPHPGDWTAVGHVDAACDGNRAMDTTAQPLFVKYLDVLCEIMRPMPYEVPGVVPVKVKLTNKGNVPVTIPRLDVVIGPTSGYADYREDIDIPVGGNQEMTLTPWACPVGGSETCTAWITYAEDMNHSDPISADTAVVAIKTGIPGWMEMTPLPAPPSGKAVKDGGCMAYDAGTDLIYGSKGNKTGDFYTYNTLANAWTNKAGIPLGAEGKQVGKGSVICSDGNGKLYLTKGNNTPGFWEYDAATNAWIQKTNVPFGSSGKKVKQGAGIAWGSKGGIEYAYLLKGYRNEFYKYDPATNTWFFLLDAPIGTHLKWDAGSWLVADPTSSKLYAHKGKYHEFYSYDTEKDSWSAPLKPMPIPGSNGNKKAKEGSCAAWYNGKLYALKGGNTTEFWRYFIVGDSWHKQDDIPLSGVSGARKKVKAGAAMAGYPGLGVYAFKGNKSLEFWRFTPYDVAGAQPGRDGVEAGSFDIGNVSFAIAPNPLAGGLATVRYSLPKAGLATLSVFDVTGRTVLEQTLAAGRTGSASLDLRKLEAGVYLVKVTTEGFSTTQKLVVEH